MDTQFILFIVLVFIAAFFALETFYFWWTKRYGAEASRLKRRIEAITNHDLDRSAYQSILKNRYESLSPINQLISKLFFANKLDELILQSGKLWTIAKFFKLTGVSALAGIVLGMVAQFSLVYATILGLATAAIPLWTLIRARTMRLKKFEEQLPDAIDSICRSLKAGHSFLSAFGLVGEEFADPIATEFRITMEETKLGVSLNDAMQNLAKRVPVTDLRFFVIAILIQRETGGNLTEVLSKIGYVLRERFTLARQIGVMTAEGRLSAKILAVMPLVMIGILSALNPTYAPLLFNTQTGQYWLKVGLVMMCIGAIWMRSIIKIRM